jgi:hypothetical protein
MNIGDNEIQWVSAVFHLDSGYLGGGNRSGRGGGGEPTEPRMLHVISRNIRGNFLIPGEIPPPPPETGLDETLGLRAHVFGFTFEAAEELDVNITPIKHKFYGAFNSLMSRCKYAVEPVKLQLLKSFCMPLLSFCLGMLSGKYLICRDLSLLKN